MVGKKALTTVGNKWILELDGPPNSSGGFTAPIGSEAFVNNSGIGSQWYKFGNNDTDWRNVTDSVGNLNTIIVSSNYSLTSLNDALLCNTTSASFVVNLPQASTVQGKIFTLKKLDSSINKVSITPYSGESIDNSTSPYDLELEGEFVQLLSDGISSFKVIGE